MIIDTIQNAHFYFHLGRRMEIALKMLPKMVFTDKMPGRFNIAGDEIFALVQEYQTKLKGQDSWEAHKKYIDIHYVITGAELIGYANLKVLQVIKPYDRTIDAMLLKGQGDFLTLTGKNFAIFYPDDAHMPGLAISGKKSKLKKIVVKVKYDKP